MSVLGFLRHLDPFPHHPPPITLRGSSTNFPSLYPVLNADENIGCPTRCLGRWELARLAEKLASHE